MHRFAHRHSKQLITPEPMVGAVQSSECKSIIISHSRQKPEESIHCVAGSHIIFEVPIDLNLFFMGFQPGVS